MPRPKGSKNIVATIEKPKETVSKNAPPLRGLMMVIAESAHQLRFGGVPRREMLVRGDFYTCSTIETGDGNRAIKLEIEPNATLKDSLQERYRTAENNLVFALQRLKGVKNEMKRQEDIAQQAMAMPGDRKDMAGYASVVKEANKVIESLRPRMTLYQDEVDRINAEMKALKDERESLTVELRQWLYPIELPGLDISVPTYDPNNATAPFSDFPEDDEDEPGEN